MDTLKVLAFAGSLRKGSWHRSLIEVSRQLAPEGMEIEHYLLDDIPMYNMDLEQNWPQVVVEFKDKIRAADGLLITVPEHNYSYSGVLKNALDWASRPVTETPLNDKPVVLQSASTNFAGGARAQYHLRQVLGYFPMKQMFFPELFVNSAKGKFDESGNLIDQESKDRIAKQLQAFKEFIIAERRP